MDDGDGAGVVEMMAGQDPNVILQTIYNGSGTCTECGSLINPVSAMFTGTLCPACTNNKGAHRVKSRMGV
jgi:hypothetical protein